MSRPCSSAAVPALYLSSPSKKYVIEVLKPGEDVVSRKRGFTVTSDLYINNTGLRRDPGILQQPSYWRDKGVAFVPSMNILISWYLPVISTVYI